MTIIKLLLFCYGVPVVLIVIGFGWLWGGLKFAGWIFMGG